MKILVIAFICDNNKYQRKSYCKFEVGIVAKAKGKMKLDSTHTSIGIVVCRVY